MTLGYGITNDKIAVDVRHHLGADVVLTEKWIQDIVMQLNQSTAVHLTQCRLYPAAALLSACSQAITHSNFRLFHQVSRYGMWTVCMRERISWQQQCLQSKLSSLPVRHGWFT